jgi:glyoxylase-like metal-dependent hydrolase (beta-lactamase superfamily II)
MRKLASVMVCAFLALSVPSPAQQPDPIRTAAEALGAINLTSLGFTGLGANFSVGQNASPGEPWPRVTIKNYAAAINYDVPGMRVEVVREQGSVPPRGGGVPFVGEQRFIEFLNFLNGGYAWNVPLAPSPPPEKGSPAPPLAAGPPRFVEQAPQPLPATVSERLLQIWLTPHGFLKAALANKAAARRVGDRTEITFTLDGKFRFIGTLNRMNQVERVQTWIANPVLGDMSLEAQYSDYERADGGVWFPGRITQKQGGYPSLDLWIFSVRPNVSVDIATPDVVRTSKLAPIQVEVQKIADGVHYLTGGSHHSVAIEMRDHVVLVEGPLNEERSLAVIAKLNETIPGKPIRFVVNTHHHFDHSGGLRTYADLGATIVTHELNRAFYEKAWAVPRTLGPDRLAQSRRAPVFQTFTDRHTLSDGARTIEIHRIANSPHHDGFAMVYLPAEKLLIEADAYTPPPPPPPAASGAPPSPPPFAAQGPVVNPTTRNLYENIRRLKLDVERIAALHGPRLATLDDLAEVSGR